MLFSNTLLYVISFYLLSSRLSPIRTVSAKDLGRVNYNLVLGEAVDRETEGFNQYVLVMTDCYLIFVVELSCAPIRIDNDRELDKLLR